MIAPQEYIHRKPYRRRPQPNFFLHFGRRLSPANIIANPFFGIFHSIGQSRMLAYSNGFSNEGQSGNLKGTIKENFNFTS